MNEGILKAKSIKIADTIFVTCLEIQESYKEYIVTKQLIRAAFSICANYTEAGYSQSRRVFVQKLNISRRECAEALFWLERLVVHKYISIETHTVLSNELTEVLKLLNASCKTARMNRT